MVTFLLSSLFFIHLAFLYLNPVWVSLNLDYFLFILYPYVRIKYLHMYHSVFIFCIDYLLWYRRNFFAHNFSSMELAKDMII